MSTSAGQRAAEPRGRREPGDVTPELEQASTWTDQMVQEAGIPVVDKQIVSVGSGLGSFALVDTLRVAGVPADRVAVLGRLDVPYQTYRYLAANSQIPDAERLRSDAGSVMDNIWGFPSYAWREGWRAKALKPFWTVFSEPLGAEYYTPRAGQVYASVDREMPRIGWQQMLVRGQVRHVRRRAGGGWYVLLTPPAGTSPTRRVAYRAQHVHVAVGYAGVRFLDDLQTYREQTGDYERVVNAYEPHDNVYAELRRRQGSVLVRGSGIVASRVLQRLIDDREQHGARTTIYHLFRNYVSGPQGQTATFRRPGGGGYAYQAFNFPKAAWGGQLRDQLEAADDAGRRQLVSVMGGTNTPYRSDWQRQMREGREQGFYRQLVGTVQSVEKTDGGVRTTVKTSDGPLVVDADVVIDATGLDADLKDNRVLADLLDHAGASRNGSRRLAVDTTFEVTGTRSGDGRLYASGSSTLGGPYAGVDSFLGLQYVAMKIADDLADAGAAPRLGAGRSVSQWFRWLRNRTPEGGRPGVGAPQGPPPHGSLRQGPPPGPPQGPPPGRPQGPPPGAPPPSYGPPGPPPPGYGPPGPGRAR